MPKGEKAPINIVGERFGRLKVIRRMPNNKYSKTRWLCKCDYGNTVVVVGNNLKSGNTKS